MIRRLLLGATAAVMVAGSKFVQPLDVAAQDILPTVRAAEQGDAEAQFNLGNIYERGVGVAQDSAEAARWYRMAAELGGAEASDAVASLEANSERLEKLPRSGIRQLPIISRQKSRVLAA